MGTHGSYTLIDTTPAKIILVYRNGDPYYTGKKFVLHRRRVLSFEAFLDQLNQEMEVPFGVRRLYTPTHGHQVCELDALQQGGKYVAAGRERFKKLDYFHIAPRKPSKIRKLKEIKPVVHCEINVPSRWQTFNRISRHINVFTNGRLYIPPAKVVIPKFSLSDWNSVLALVGEKVFPLGGVRKLFTMDGRLLDSSEDLQEHHFYVAAGTESFKHLPYWKSSKVPSEVQRKYSDTERHPRRKKKEDSKGKEPCKPEENPPNTQESVYYAKESKQKPLVQPFITSGAEGDVYKARTPNAEAQGALEVKEDQDVKEEVPVDQEGSVGLGGRQMAVTPRRRMLEMVKKCETVSYNLLPAEIIKEDEEMHNNMNEIKDNKENEDERLGEDNERKGDNSGMSFKKSFPLRYRTKRKDKRLIKWIPLIFKYEGGVCTTPEPKSILVPDRHLATRTDPPWRHKCKTMLRTATWPKGETALSLHPKDLVLALELLSRGPVNSGQLQGSSFLIAFENFSTNKKVVPFLEKEPYDILKEKHSHKLLESRVKEEAQRTPPLKQQLQQSSLKQQGQIPEKQKYLGQPSLIQPFQEQIPEEQEFLQQSSLRQSFQEQIPKNQESIEQSSLRQSSQEQIPKKQESFEQSSLRQSSQEQISEKQESFKYLLPEQETQEQVTEKQEHLQQLSLSQSSQQQVSEKQKFWEQQAQEQTPETEELLEQPSPRQQSPEQILEKQESLEQSSPRQSSQGHTSEREESLGWQSPRQSSQGQISEKQECLELSVLEHKTQEQAPEKQEPLEKSSPEQPSQEQIPQEQETQEQLS